MPRVGDSPLVRFADAIVDQVGYSFGWPAPSDDGTAVLLPVLRTGRDRGRYGAVHEASDAVSAVDSGRIDRLRVRNDSARRIFLPPGTLFAGRETASRGTSVGVLLEPGAVSDVEVRCVHAASPITPGARLELDPRLAPGGVRSALVSRDQGLVWASVREYVRSRMPEAQAGDDLLGALAPEDRDQRAAGTPGSSADEPCGVIVLDTTGVEAAEIFDDPDAWMASAAGVADRGLLDGSTVGLPAMAGPLMPEKAVELAKEFLRRLRAQPWRPVSTRSWTSRNASATWTVVDGEVSHLLAYRTDPWSAHATRMQAAAIPGGLASGGIESRVGAASRTVTIPTDDGDVAAEASAMEAEDEPEPSVPRVLPRRRKVLTSGWDAATFDSLERYAGKEYSGDRSAAIRFLVRQGLGRRGYFGPRSPPSAPWPASAPILEEGTRGAEPGSTALEARIHDYARIAETETFAAWLRARAQAELERMASSLQDDALRELAHAALQRLPSPPSEPQPEAVVEAEEIVPEPAPAPSAPPLDVRPLLRRAFSASAAGQFSDALHLFDAVLEAEPEDRTALLGRAVALRRSGKTSEALEALDRVLRLEPGNAAALLNRARVLQERGEFPAALETLDRLGAVAPNDWDVWMARGDVLARMGREHDALAAYAEALRRNPDDEALKAKIRGIERARIPPPTSASRVALPRDIQEGQSYLVHEAAPDLGYRAFRALSIRSVPCLLVTPRDADRVRGEQGLGGMRILELTSEPGGDRLPPSSLVELTNALEHFLTENRGRAAILLEGLSQLVQANGFRETALFLAHMNEAILPSQGIFLVTLARGELAEKEIAILERDLRPLS